MHLKLLATILVTMLAFASSASADLVGINFIGGRNNRTDGVGAGLGASPTTTAFGIDAADWNNVGDRANPSGGPEAVTGVDGTSLNLNWQSNNTWSMNNDQPAGDGEVFGGYLDDGGNGTQPLIIVTGLDAVDRLVSYSVRVIHSTDGADSEDIQLSPLGFTPITIDNPVLNNAPNGGGKFGISLFENLTASEFQIATLGDGGRGSIGGLIIDLNIAPAIPEPTTAVLGLLGMAGLARRRRRLA